MAQSYACAIDQLPPLNDPLAEMTLEHFGGHAPAVAAGQLRDNSHVAQATNECNDLQWLRRNQANVTNLEIAAAELRKSKILVEHGGGPLTMNALQQLLATLRQDLTQEIQQLRQDLTQQNQQTQDQMKVLSAQFSNLGIKRHNLQAMNSPLETRLTLRLKPLLKTKEGFGNGFPNHDVPDFAPATVGDPIPGELFPATVGGIEDLTHQKLSDISAWLNEDFGELPGETTHAPRITKFRDYIS